MDLLDFLVHIFILGLSFFAGYVYRDLILIKDLTKITNELNTKLGTDLRVINDDEDDLEVNDIKKLNHEIIGGVHYFFSDETFVCQGITLIEAAKNYTTLHGKDTMGLFKHTTLNKEFVLVNNECLEFVNERI